MRQFYVLLYAGKIEGCSLGAFEDATGLKLRDGDGSLLDDLPPITIFLNRLLALRIDLQNSLFAAFEVLLHGKSEGSIAAGVYEAGVETVIADSLKVTTRRTVYINAASGAETRDRNRPLTLDEAFSHAEGSLSKLLVNTQSGRATVQVPAPHITLDDGDVERRIRLIRPMERTAIGLKALGAWQHRRPRHDWRNTDPTTRRPPSLHHSGFSSSPASATRW